MRLNAHHRVVGVLLAALVLSGAGRTNAQPLADRVPADALVYVGWQGADHLGEAYEQSHFKAVLDASNARLVFKTMLPSLIRKLSDSEPQVGAAGAAVASIGSVIWKHPTAFYFGGMDFAPNQPPTPKLALYIDAGEDAGQVVKQINQIVEQSGAPLKVTVKEGLVTVSMGPSPTTVKSLRDNPRFMAAMKKLNANPVFVGYADGRGIMKLVDDAIASEEDEESKQMWTTVKDALGLDGLKQAAVSAAFENKKWSTRAYVDAPKPRKGLLSLLDAEPLSDDALKVVPKSASTVFAARFDLSHFYSEIRTALGKFNNDWQLSFDEAVEDAGAMVGFDIKKELIDALGDEWVIYAGNNTAGNGMLGYVLVNKLRKPVVFEKSARRLQAMAVGMINGFMNSDTMAIRDRHFKYDDMAMHAIGAPLISPTWTVHDKHLVAGLYPQVVAAGGNHVNSGKASILDNPRFIAMKKQLGVTRFNSVAFYDLEQVAGDGYQMLLAVSQLYLGLADMFGIETPPMVLPPLNKIRPHLSPAMSATWSDAYGWYAISMEPFPGSTLLGSSGNLMISQNALVIGTLLPALGAARRTARRMQTGTQVRGLHQGAVLWSNGANGNFPPDLATLYENDYFTIEYAIAPTSDVNIPVDFQQWDKKKRADWINSQTSFCYVTGLRDDNDSRKVVVFERLHYKGQTTVAIAFNDNHVETHDIEAASEMIKKQTGRSLEEWSRSKYPGAGGK